MPIIGRIEWHHEDKLNSGIVFRKVQEEIKEDGSELSLLAFESVPLFCDPDEETIVYVLRKLAAGENSDYHYSEALSNRVDGSNLYDWVKAGLLV